MKEGVPIIPTDTDRWKLQKPPGPLKQKGWGNLHTMHDTSGILLFKENQKIMSHFKGSKKCDLPRAQKDRIFAQP